ncbi:MAG: sortase [Rhodoglobus sp.]
MIKKTLAIAALAVAAVFAVPTAALAAGYVPEGNIIVEGPAAPGGFISVSFTPGSFSPGEPISLSITGEPTATLGVVLTGTVTGSSTAGADGSLGSGFTLPSNATGTYTFTATGLVSGNVGSASVSVTPADSGTGGSGGGGGGGLVNTGAQFPVLGLWIGGGALLLGGALIAVLAIARKQRAQA